MKKKWFIITASVLLIAAAAVFINSATKKNAPIREKVSEKHSLDLLHDSAKGFEKEKAYLKARALYKDIIKKSKDDKLIKEARKDLMAINMKILFSPVIDEDSVFYRVKEGDTLGKIARKFNTTVELIKKSNGLGSDMIMIGQRLKVSTAKYSVAVDCSRNVLILKSGENIFKVYDVATGINGSTPLGTFKIVNKEKDPVWYKTGAVIPSGSPENILGSRWMGLSIAHYGIHGTTIPESIGKHVTAGCVRMLESDVQELYDILPVGTEVTISRRQS